MIILGSDEAAAWTKGAPAKTPSKTKRRPLNFLYLGESVPGINVSIKEDVQTREMIVT